MSNMEKATIGVRLSRAYHRRGREPIGPLNTVMDLFCVPSQYKKPPTLLKVPFPFLLYIRVF